MSEPLRVFVNGKGYAVPQGSTVIDAIVAADATAAEEVRNGTRGVVDSRGVGIASTTLLSGGFVMRVVSARAAKEGVDE